MEFLHSKKLAINGTGTSTQKYVDVEEVKEGVIVLKSGALRSVLMVSSINFDLKSTEEQDAIVSQYQNFINSLDFPIQIIVSSRKLDIKPYLEFLKTKESQIASELLRLQISEYQNFIRNLAEISNIMSKMFYIIVPFSPVETKEGGFFNKVTSIFNPRQAVMEKRNMFETFENQLWQRVDQIIAGLSGIGLKVAPLGTDEVIELLYNSYNPTVYNKTAVKDTEKLELSK
jgi:hypothetical protein